MDCASLLHRPTERGYLQATFAESGRGRPLRYRLTTRAISVLGYSSLEEVQQLFATLRAGVRRGTPLDDPVSRDADAAGTESARPTRSSGVPPKLLPAVQPRTPG